MNLIFVELGMPAAAVHWHFVMKDFFVYKAQGFNHLCHNRPQDGKEQNIGGSERAKLLVKARRGAQPGQEDRELAAGRQDRAGPGEHSNRALTTGGECC